MGLEERIGRVIVGGLLVGLCAGSVDSVAAQDDERAIKETLWKFAQASYEGNDDAMAALMTTASAALWREMLAMGGERSHKGAAPRSMDEMRLEIEVSGATATATFLEKGQDVAGSQRVRMAKEDGEWRIDLSKELQLAASLIKGLEQAFSGMEDGAAGPGGGLSAPSAPVVEGAGAELDSAQQAGKKLGQAFGHMMTGVAEGMVKGMAEGMAEGVAEGMQQAAEEFPDTWERPVRPTRSPDIRIITGTTVSGRITLPDLDARGTVYVKFIPTPGPGGVPEGQGYLAVVNRDSISGPEAYYEIMGLRPGTYRALATWDIAEPFCEVDREFASCPGTAGDYIGSSPEVLVAEGESPGQVNFLCTEYLPPAE